MQLAIETVCFAINRVLYAFFNTAWALIYFFAFWRNAIFGVLVVAALAVDFARRDGELCRRITLHVTANRAAWLLAALAALLAMSLLVVLAEAKPFSFAAAYLHYEHAVQYAGLVRARMAYAVEATGIGFSFLLLVFFSVRQSSGLVELKRVPPPDPPWLLREFWGTFAFLILASVFAMLGVIGSIPGPRFRPGSDIGMMIMVALTPTLLAGGIKYWLMAGCVLTTEPPATLTHGEKAWPEQ